MFYFYKRIYVLINTHISVIYLNIEPSGARSKGKEIVEEGLKRSLDASHFHFWHRPSLPTWFVVYCSDKVPKCVGYDLKVITFI